MGAVPLPGGEDPLTTAYIKLRDYIAALPQQHRTVKCLSARPQREDAGASSPCIPASAAFRTFLADTAMILVQLLFVVNQLRRLLDASPCSHVPSSYSTGLHGGSALPWGPASCPILNYPCNAPLGKRLAFLAVRLPATLRAAFRLPLGELWVPLTFLAVLGHLALLLLLPRTAYMAGARRVCMLLVAMLPKAASLVAFLAFPGERASSYFATYLPLEGVIMLSHHLVDDHPFWPGLLVLAGHCTLTTMMCVAVELRAVPTLLSTRDQRGRLQHPILQDSAPLPSYSTIWVLAHTYLCALLAVLVTLQHHPAVLFRARRYVQRWLVLIGGQDGEGLQGPVVPPAGPTAGAVPSQAGSQAPGDAAGSDSDATTGGQYRCTAGVSCSCGCAIGSGGTRHPGMHLALGLLRGLAQRGRSARVVSVGKDGGGYGGGRSPVGLDAAGSPAFTAVASCSHASEAASAASATSNAELEGSAMATAAAAEAAAALSSSTAMLNAGSTAASGPLVAAVRIAKGMANSPYGGGGRSAVRGALHSSVPTGASALPAATLPATPTPPPQSPLRVSAALPPAGAFSLKQPMGLSKLTIVEDQEFRLPAATAVGVVGVTSSLEAISLLSSRGRRFKRYQSRAPPQRVYMKIPWAEPDQLPANFLERLNLALSEGLDCMAVGVAARAGCIELVFDVVPHDAASAGLRDARARAQAYADASDMSPAAAAAAAAAFIERLRPWNASGQRNRRNDGASPSMQGLFMLGHSNTASGGGADFANAPVEGMRGAAVSSSYMLDTNTAVEEAVLSGLMITDAEPASWIDALHLQPPPGAEVLTQACGRVWISRWDQSCRQWVPEKAGGIRPSQLPRILHLHPLCILLGTPPEPMQLDQRRGDPSLGDSSVTDLARARSLQQQQRREQQQQQQASPTMSQASMEHMTKLDPEWSGAAVGSARAPSVQLTVSNAGTMPSFSARCRGRYLPINVQQIRWGASDDGTDPGSPEESSGRRASAPGARVTLRPQDDSASELGRVDCGSSSARVVLELPAGLPRNGLVVVECKVGKLVSNWRPILLTEDPLLVADLATLANDVAAAAEAASDPSCNWDELLTDLGLWLDYLEVRGLTEASATAASAAAADPATAAAAGDDGSSRSSATLTDQGTAMSSSLGSGGSGSISVPGGGGDGGSAGGLARQSGSLDFGHSLVGLYGTERYRSHMAGIVVSLVEFAVDRGWTHTTGLLVSQAIAAGISWSDLLARCSDGLTLLHRAVRSAVGEMVELVIALGERHGAPFDWQAACSSPSTAALLAGAGAGAAGGAATGPAEEHAAEGVTPLHLAAALPDGGRLAERILSEYQAACELWVSALDRNGLRPVDCARASGRLVTQTPVEREQQQQPVAAAAAAAVQPAGSSAPPAAKASAVVPAAAVASPSRPRAPVAAPAPAPAPVAPAAVKAGPASDTGPLKGKAGKEAAACYGQSCSSTDSASRGGAVAFDSGLWASMATSLTAPFVNDRRTEEAYLQAVGAASVLRCCAYLVYQMSMVAAVGGRMFKELRQHEMYGMLLFLTPHVVSALLICFNYAAWLRSREALFAAVTLTRTTAKLLPVLEALPYPHSSTNYMSWGMDVLLEGFIPAIFEHVRGPLVLPLRVLEGVVTGLLYRKLGALPTLPAALVYALTWNIGCGLLTVAMDSWFRLHWLGRQGQAQGRGGGGGGPGRERAPAGPVALAAEAGGSAGGSGAGVSG